tara:strand:- start:2759 stop:3253 length:495 start_codon:yes stop_codon:yes gene_type:complete
MSLLLGILLIAPLPELEWTIDYEVFEEGPRFVCQGEARLNITEDNLTPCLSYQFEIPEGTLAGPAISSSPGLPMLAFDIVTHTDVGLSILWCQPFAEYLSLPKSNPRHFVFYVIKNKFGPEDLSKMLGDWGLDDSPWDLDLDFMVDGSDLNILLGGWDHNEGSS